jgi:hypothetical protein
MFRVSLFAAGALLAAMAMSPQTASAGTIPPNPALQQEASGLLLKEVQFGYCRRWRRICAARWGWGTRRFVICMRRHGC